MNTNPNNPVLSGNHNRIEIIDSLRGFALLGIMLIHGVEQFNFFYRTEHHFLFSTEFDRVVSRLVFFMISQKAYSIFAIMFGISFYIQMKNQEQKGIDFRMRFAWRLMILLLMGIVHTFFYNGDILSKYAILGFVLLLTYRFNTKLLWVLAIMLVLQLPFILQLVRSFYDHDYMYKPLRPAFSEVRPGEIFAHGSFIEVLKFNLWKGNTRSITWSYNTGRIYQLMALFIFGFILGRKNFFNRINTYKKLILKTLIICVIIGVSLQIAINYLSKINLSEQQWRLINVILSSYFNLCFTLVLISLFLLIYTKVKGFVFRQLAMYGRLSLTSYLTQTLFGTLFFYGYGFGMYNYMGYTRGLIYGIVFFILQIVFCNWWIKRYRYGPAEWLWRALTIFDFKLKNRIIKV